MFGKSNEDSPHAEAPISIYLQDRQERLLWDLDAAHLLHALLALFLLLEELALARDVAAVALRGDVFAEGADGLAGDDLAADRGLDGDLVLLLGDELLELLCQPAAALICAVLVGDDRE